MAFEEQHVGCVFIAKDNMSQSDAWLSLVIVHRLVTGE